MSTNALVIPSADFSANKLTQVAFGTVPCTGISLSSSTASFIAVGETATITATLTPANTTDTLSWASSDNSVASVANGVITAVAAGSATITATCGEQSATVSVSVVLDPAFIVVGGFNARLGGGGVYNENTAHSSSPGKYGILVASSTDTSLKAWDRSGHGEYEGDYSFVPIKIPTGAKRIKLKYIGTPSVSFKTRFLFCDSTQSPSGYTGVKCVDGKGNNQWDQDSAVTEYTVAIPDVSGLDSFGVCLYMSDYILVWNVDSSADFEITYLYTAS